MLVNLKPYPKMKDSGVQWLGSLPDHWEARRTKRAVVINPGKSEASSLAADTPVTFLPMECVGTDGRVSFTELRPARAVWIGFTYFRRSDVLVAKITPCFENGKGACLDGMPTDVGFGSTEFHVLRASKRIIPQYLYRMTTVSEFRRLGAETMTGAAGQQRVPQDFLGDFPIPIPPLSEQSAIVRFLDHADRRIRRYIRAKQKLIKLLEEQKQAIIHRAVTRGLDINAETKLSSSRWFPEVPRSWDVLPMRRVILSAIDGPHFSPTYVDSGIPFLSARNIKVDCWSLEDAKYITEADYREFSRRVRPELGDVLYTKGGTTGIAHVVDLKFPFQVWVHIAVLKPKRDLILPEFLAAALNSPRCYEQSQLFTRGATNQDLGLGRMKDIDLPVPPSLDEQRAIVRRLQSVTSQVTSTITQTHGEISLLREYRTRLIADVVTGKLDVREAAAKLPVEPEPAGDVELPEEEVTEESGEGEPQDENGEPGDEE